MLGIEKLILAGVNVLLAVIFVLLADNYRLTYRGNFMVVVYAILSIVTLVIAIVAVIG